MLKKLSILLGSIILTLSAFSQVSRGALLKKDTTVYKPDTTLKYQVLVDNDSNLVFYNGRRYYLMVAAGSSSALPSQSGNAGKFLNTNGTVASWLNPFNNPVLPALQHNSTPTSYYWTLSTGERFLILREDTTYQSNSFNGSKSGLNLFIGRSAGNLTSNGGGNNIGFGDSALNSLTTGWGEIGIGMKSLKSNTTGFANTAVGQGTLSANTTGTYNTAIGTNALLKATTANYNTAIGSSSMYYTTTGEQNTAVGNTTMTNLTTGFRNSVVGVSGMSLITTGSYNSGIGSGQQTHGTTSSYNSGVGYHNFHYNTTGNYNSALGALAGEGLNGGSYNTLIGYAQGQSIPAATSHLLLIGSHPHPTYTGDTTNAIIVGFMDSLAANQRLVINANVTINGTINTNNILTGSATLSFPTFGANQANTLTITVSGAAIGDVVALGTPGGVGSNTTEGIIFWAYVSATNTVAIRAVNGSGTPLSPTPGVFTVKVFK